MGGSQSTNIQPPQTPEPAAPAVSPTSQGQEVIDINKALNAVAAQVYDNVHEQLASIQKEQLDRSAVMAKEIKARMEPVVLVKGGVACEAETKNVTECLRANKGAPLKCDAFVEALARCASAAARAQ